MKSFVFKSFVIFMATVPLIYCTDISPSYYILELPAPPAPWLSLLGEPHWRLEWLDSQGKKQIADIAPGQKCKIEPPTTWVNPVTAWPYWPEYKLFAGLFKPAGALFPFDASGKNMLLSWESGVDSVFYWELARVNNDNFAKIPANFDWLRFRNLFSDNLLDEAVIKDPWLVDWPSVAEKTILGNFDRRRLIPKSVQKIAIPVPEGPWYSSSALAQPLSFFEELPVFPVSEGVNVWFSKDGILRLSGQTWVFRELK